MRKIYLDYNATSPVLPEVLKEMLPFFCERFGNPSSPYSYGQEARKALEIARERCAALIGADPGEIIFTSGGSESNNFAIFASLERDPSRKEIVTSLIEHSSILSPCKKNEGRGGEVKYLPVNGEGIVDTACLEKEIGRNTALVSVMLANNEVGTIQPIGEISKISQMCGVPVHTDAVQAAGKIKIDVKKLGVELLSLASHKIYGPKGAGALYVKKGMKLSPFIYGGGQEKGLRSGTENLAAVVGFGKACDLAMTKMEERIKHHDKLRALLLKELELRVKDVRINTPLDKSLKNTLSVGFAGVPSDALVVRLDLDGICVSGGSACLGLSKVSHVLKAMGVPLEYLLSSIRISLGIPTTEDEIICAADKIAGNVAEIRKCA